MRDWSEISEGLVSSQGVSIPLEKVEVHADIAGRGARVKVCQHFRNRGESPIEAVYKFPLPEAATVCGFRAVVGKRVIEGRIEEREKAFEIYDTALSKGHGSQLLDQERPNIFTLSVGNIRPGDATVIEISYVELLESHGSGVRFFLPTTISPRYVPAGQPDRKGIPEGALVNQPHVQEAPYGLKIDVNVHGLECISSIESPTHTISTKFTGSRANIAFSSEVAAMDRDFVLNVAYGEGFASRGFLYREGGEAFIQVDFAAAGDDAEDEGADSGKGREMIFVLDCSGSMDGESIAEAKKALKIAVKALKPGMLFNVYLFGSTFKSLYLESRACDEKTLSEALKYLGRAAADLGGTEVLKPFENIYSRKSGRGIHRDIFLITDGEVGNETEVMRLVKRNARHTKVYTVGIGSGPNEFFVKGVARASGGVSEMVAPMEKIEPKIVRLFGNALAGRVDDVQIAWGAGVQQAPEAPALFLGQPRTIFARLEDASAGVESVKISGKTLNGSRDWVIDIQPVGEKGLPVPKLWAREWIRDLEEGDAHARGSRQKERVEHLIAEEIIGISKKYGIISSRTSFVGVDERPESERSTDEIVIVKVPGTLTKGWGGQRRMDVDVFADYSVLYSSANMLSVPSAPKWWKKTDVLQEILSFQRPEGGFDYGRLLELNLRFSQPAIDRIREGLEENIKKFCQRFERLREMLEDFRRGATRDVQRWTNILNEAVSACSGLGTDQTAVMLRRDVQRFSETVEMNISKFSKTTEDYVRRLESDVVPRVRGIDSQKIVVTMVALLWLEDAFDDRRPEWEQAVHKSRHWLQDQMAAVAMIMNPGELEYRAMEFVREWWD